MNVSDVGLKVRGAVAPPEPVPESATNCGENAAASLMATAPLTLPLEVGVNVTAILHLAFEAKETPQVVPLELIA